MMIRRITQALFVGVASAGLTLGALGAGTGIANADPGPTSCGPQICSSAGYVDHRGPGGQRGPGGPDGPGRGIDGPGHGIYGPERGIDQGRYDHRPFNYNGQWVTPIFRPELPQPQWGFWLYGVWIPL